MNRGGGHDIGCGHEMGHFEYEDGYETSLTRPGRCSACSLWAFEKHSINMTHMALHTPPFPPFTLPALLVEGSCVDFSTETVDPPVLVLPP